MSGTVPEPVPSGRRRLVVRLILIAAAAAVLLQTLVPVLTESGTFDEPMYLAAGYAALKTGDLDVLEHPHLPYVVAALPLMATDARLPERPTPWNGVTRWRWALDFLYRSNDADGVLFWGRLTVVLMTVALVLLVFRMGRAQLGTTAGVAALAAATFSPSILAHGHLVTNDLPMTLLFAAVVFAFWGLARRVTLGRIALVGILLGLAAMTKHTSLLFGALLPLLALARTLQGDDLTVALPGRRLVASSRVSRATALALSLLAVVVLAWGVVWAAHGFRYEAIRTPGYHSPHPKENMLPAPGPARTAILAAERARILPEAYLNGLGYALRHAEKRRAFLAGEYSNTGWWYFFPAAIGMKTPLPLLGLGLLGTGLLSRRVVRGPDRFTALCVTAPPILLVLTAMTQNLNIGHRHVLPLYPFLFLAAGAAAAFLIERGRVARVALTILSGWFLSGSLLVAPHYLAYFNETVGGPRNGWRYLVDSNIDWGQDLASLAAFQNRNGIETLYLSYFGSADPDYYGLRYVALPSFAPLASPRRSPWPPSEKGTWVAVSVTNLQGLYLENRDLFAQFREREPVARIGYSIYVYRQD